MRAFFSVRFSPVLDPLGHATFLRRRLYGEESLAGSEAAIWLQEKSLTLEHAGEPLSRYEVEHAPSSGAAGKLLAVRHPVLFETSRALPRPRLFRLDVLGEGGWLKALKLEEYAPRRLENRWPCSRCSSRTRRSSNYILTRSFSPVLLHP